MSESIQEIQREQAEKKSIFISHFHEEESIAGAIREVLLKCFGEKVDVFLSKTILFGEDWSTSVNVHLKKSNLLLILFSPESVERPWINIEAGYGIIEGKDVIPMYCLGLDQEKLHYAYQRLKGINIENSNDIRRLLEENIAKKLLNGTITESTREECIDHWHQTVSEAVRLYINEQTVKYHLEPESYFHVVNEETNRCLDVYDYNIEEGAQIIGYAPHSGRNQLWKLQRVNEKYFRIVSKLTGMCLEVVKTPSSGGDEIQNKEESKWDNIGLDNAVIILKKYADKANESHHQHWSITEVRDNHSYKIGMRANPKICISIQPHPHDVNRSDIKLTFFADQKHQMWLFKIIKKVNPV
jgi:hypothetical protein